MKQTMNRRSFLKTCVAGLVTARLASSSADASLALENKTLSFRLGRKRPNVIHIMTDDLGYGDIGCFGQQKIETPCLDKMAAEGMRFTQHYSDTICAPSRCILLTGLHTGHSYVRDNYETGGYQLPLPSWTKTIGHIFQEAGYVTGCVGKWGLGGPGSSGHPNLQGFDYFYGYLGQAQAHNYYPDHLWENTDQVPLGGQHYSHDLMTEKVLSFIETNSDRPFFMYVPYTIPHTKFQVPELGQYANKAGWSANQKTQAAMISRMDRDVGRIIDSLKRLGIDRDTIVFFTSDNGPHGFSGTNDFFNANGPLRGIKRDLYEGGIRVPMIARWPGEVRPGTTTDHISTFWDIFPTCCDLMGVRTPKVRWSDGSNAETDGISFLPALLGRDHLQREHEYLYWEFKARHIQAVRKGKWKLVRKNVHTGSPISELYDLDADLAESIDIASSHPVIVGELESIATGAHILNPNYPILYGE